MFSNLLELWKKQTKVGLHSNQTSQNILTGDLWQAVARSPVNTLNIQSHRPVSPALLFKHSLKPTLFCNVNSQRTSLLGALLHDMHRGTSTQQRNRCNRPRDRKKSNRGQNNRGSCAPPHRSPPPCLASWRVWLRDRPTLLRAIRPNRCYAPELLSKPSKLDYWDPSSMAYISSTCKTLAGHHGLNGNPGQIKVDWPVYTLSRTHRWMLKGNMSFQRWRSHWQDSPPESFSCSSITSSVPVEFWLVSRGF